MRVLIAVIALLSCPAFGAEAHKPLLISGYDDVVRQANNTGLFRAAVRTLSRDETFAGMSELYGFLTEPASSPGFIVVSATSLSFKEDAQKFLRDAGYPPASLHFRRWLTQWSAESFKYAQIEKIVAAKPGQKAIFIFDNSETSLSLSARLLHEHPTLVSSLYLRETVKRDAPQSAVTFITAFDIAANEFSAGRITQADVRKVATAIVEAEPFTRAIPEYAHCPTDYDPCRVVRTEIQGTCFEVRAKVRRSCEARLNR